MSDACGANQRVQSRRKARMAAPTGPNAVSGHEVMP
jgi:hypothetical protein